MLRVLAIGLALAAAGCSVDATSEDPACEAGRVASCPCADGSQGQQACAEDGSEWGACSCRGAVGNNVAGSGGSASSLTAAAECLGDPVNRLTFSTGDSCPAGNIVYAVCSKAIRDAMICKPTGVSPLWCCSR